MKRNTYLVKKILLVFLPFFFAFALSAQEAKDSIRFVRFDSLYYAASLSPDPKSATEQIVRRDPANADWLTYRVLDPNAQEGSPTEVLVRMYSHPQLRRLYADTEACYTTALADSITGEMRAAFERLRVSDPQMAIPRYVAFHVSGLQQSVVAVPDLVSVSIDKYIRPDYPVYLQFFSEYARQTMSPEYVVRDAVLGWICSERPLPRETVLTLRFQLEYWGDIYRLMKQVFPQASDEWLFGFTSDQLLWMKQNRKILLDNALKRGEMESSQPTVTDRYFKELPPDQLLPPEAPRLIGHWLGANL